MVMPVMIVNSSASGNDYLYSNNAFLTEIGYNLHGLQDWFEKAYPDQDYRKEIICSRDKRQEIAKKYGHSYFHLETKVCCADGSYYWYDIYETRIDHLTVFTFLNINELEIENNRLKDAVEEKNLLLSHIVQDVRDPLLVIRTLLDNLYHNNQGLEKKQFDNILSDLGLHVGHATNLLNAALFRTGIERGAFSFQPDLIELESFLKKRYESLRHRLTKRNIRLLFKLDFHKIIFYDRFILEIAFVSIINYIVLTGKQDGDIVISNIDEDYFQSLIIADEQPSYDLESKPGTPGNTNLNTDGFNAGLLNAEKILEEHGGKLLTYKKPYNTTVWEIRINKYNVL
jgi:K+-sensing histidine kinase KdpD